MWSRRSVLRGGAVALVGVAGSLAGCGFRPLYGRSRQHDLSAVLAQVEIGPIRASTTDDQDLARVGQQLHNNLLDGLAPRGARGEPIYRLDVIISEGISSLAVQKSAVATRADLSLSASFSLSSLRSGRGLYSGSGRATASFNILNSEFATLMAEKGARDRAARQLSDDIRQKIAIFLKSYSDSG